MVTLIESTTIARGLRVCSPVADDHGSPPHTLPLHWQNSSNHCIILPVAMTMSIKRRGRE